VLCCPLLFCRLGLLCAQQFQAEEAGAVGGKLDCLALVIVQEIERTLE